MIRQRRSFGKIIKRDSGRYAASYVPPDPSSAVARVRAPHTFATRRQAEEWLASVQTDLARGDYRDPNLGKITVAEFGQRFLDDHGQRLAPRTRGLYAGLWTTWVKPTFGTVLVKDVKPSAVRSWVASMTRSGLSASRTRQAYRLLSMVLDACLEDGHVQANPCAPLRRQLPRLPEPTPHILSPTEVEALRAAMPDGRDRLMFDVLAYTGVRIGELFGLRRRSVDLLHRRLVVSEAVGEDGGKQITGDTKAHQTRRIALPGFLLDALAGHLAALSPDIDALLFPSRSGAPLRYNSWRKWVWNPAAVKAGLALPKSGQRDLGFPDGGGQQIHVEDRRAFEPGRPGPKPKPKLHDLWTVTVTPHALRATHASLVSATHGVLEAQRRLGHSSSSVTALHYARPLQGGDDAVAEWLDGFAPNSGAASSSRPASASP